MLDADLAVLYGVSTRVLNQAVKRNRERFPEDFMFCLSPALPYAFTDHGALMLANALNILCISALPKRR
jgi:hypothetical protein